MSRRLPLMLIGILIVALAILIWANDLTHRAPARIVYYATTRPQALPFSQADMKAESVLVVHTFTEARNAVSSATRIVILDDVTFAQVDKAWLIDQYQHGKVIAGINININEFLAVLPTPTSDPQNQPAAWDNYAATTSHYSILYDCGNAGRFNGGQTQDGFAATSLRSFLTRLAQDSQSCIDD